MSILHALLGQGVSLAGLCDKHSGHGAAVEITLGFGSGSLHPKTHRGPGAMDPSPGFQEVVPGKTRHDLV